MNCVQIELRIYLYYELTAEDRANLDQHMASCRSCAELHERVNENRRAMRQIFQVPAPVPDYRAMTRQVMSAVVKIQRKKQWFEIFLSNRFVDPVRYALAVLSVVLVAGFLAEHRQVVESHSRETVAAFVVPEQIPLNSESFHKSLTPTKVEAKLSVYDCVVRCLHTTQGNCMECNSRISKYN